MEKLKNIRLRSKEERRFKQGHPWVYSNELQESPKAIKPGELLELHDSGGEFLAYGFGNPNSLISFRALSREKISHPAGILTPAFFAGAIERALKFRLSYFSADQSFRVVYGEADDLPGLVIDRFAGEKEVVYVIQPHSYGMDLHIETIARGLAEVSKSFDRLHAIVVYRRDAGSREREGLEKIQTVAKELQTGAEIGETSAYRDFWFRVSGLMGSEIKMKTDLIGGQKTGFFFDQLQNVKLVQSLLLRKLRLERETRSSKGSYRILDLCTYIGQWSTHLTQTFIERECLPLEVTLVDASESALRFAEQNVVHEAKHYFTEKNVGVNRLKADVLEPLSLSPAQFDVVIADPPAFIKNRKSIPQGKSAYVNLFTTAIEKTAPSGIAVFCSCSQLLTIEEMMDCLAKATRRSKRKVRYIAQGSPSVDHPMRLEFNEGQYLKCFIAQID